MGQTGDVVSTNEKARNLLEVWYIILSCKDELTLNCDFYKCSDILKTKTLVEHLSLGSL